MKTINHFTKTQQQLDYATSTGGKSLGEWLVAAVEEFENDPSYKWVTTAQTYAENDNEAIGARFSNIDKLGINVDIEFARIRNGLYPKMRKYLPEYSLSNGLSITDDSVKEKLGRDYNETVKTKLAPYAEDAGVSYAFIGRDEKEGTKLTAIDYTGGFPIVDKFDKDKYTAFVKKSYIPSDEGDGKTELFIEYHTPFGIIEFIKDSKGGITESELKPYVNAVTRYRALGTQESQPINTGKLPVIPFYINSERKSEFTPGLKSVLDAIDYICSDAVDGITQDEGTKWIFSKFQGENIRNLYRMAYLDKVFTIPHDSADGVTSAFEAENIESPYEGKLAVLAYLKDLANDITMMPEGITSGRAVTATEINNSNKYFDSKAGDLIWCACEFAANVLDYLGIDFDEDELDYEVRSIQADEKNVDEVIALYDAGLIDLEEGIKLLARIPEGDKEPLLKRMQEKQDEDEYERSQDIFPPVVVEEELNEV